jgi:hypothetical protein
MHSILGFPLRDQTEGVIQIHEVSGGLSECCDQAPSKFSLGFVISCAQESGAEDGEQSFAGTFE